MGICTGILIGIVSGALVLLGERFFSASLRTRRAEGFTGRYVMWDAHNKVTTDGNVTVEYKTSPTDWFLGLPTQLSVIADNADSGEDWTATLEIQSSETASGFYHHGNREGGELRLTRVANSKNLTEYGIPHRDGEPFVQLLKPVEKPIIP